MNKLYRQGLGSYFMKMMTRGITATILSLLSLFFLFFVILSTPVIPDNSLWNIKNGDDVYLTGLYGICVYNGFVDNCHHTGFDDNGNRPAGHVFFLGMHPLGFVFSLLTSCTAIYASLIEDHKSGVAYLISTILSTLASIALFLAMIEDSLIYTELQKNVGVYRTLSYRPPHGTVSYGPAFGLVVMSFLTTMASLVMFIMASPINNCFQLPPEEKNVTVAAPLQEKDVTVITFQEKNVTDVKQPPVSYVTHSVLRRTNSTSPRLETPYPTPTRLAYSMPPPPLDHPYPKPVEIASSISPPRSPPPQPSPPPPPLDHPYPKPVEIASSISPPRPPPPSPPPPPPQNA